MAELRTFNDHQPGHIDLPHWMAHRTVLRVLGGRTNYDGNLRCACAPLLLGDTLHDLVRRVVLEPYQVVAGSAGGWRTCRVRGVGRSVSDLAVHDGPPAVPSATEM